MGTLNVLQQINVLFYKQQNYNPSKKTQLIAL